MVTFLVVYFTACSRGHTPRGGKSQLAPRSHSPGSQNGRRVRTNWERGLGAGRVRTCGLWESWDEADDGGNQFGVRAPALPTILHEGEGRGGALAAGQQAREGGEDDECVSKGAGAWLAPFDESGAGKGQGDKGISSAQPSPALFLPAPLAPTHLQLQVARRRLGAPGWSVA